MSVLSEYRVSIILVAGNQCCKVSEEHFFTYVVNGESLLCARQEGFCDERETAAVTELKVFLGT